MRVRREVFTVPRILVADDNTNIQKMVVLAFEERGVEVVTVGNGEAAVRRIPDMNPDLVLADVFMPVRNGYEVCEFVKKDTRFAHVPVILLVGAFDPLDEKEARRVGADGVLKKPFVPPDPLIAMVMSALEKNPKVAAELAKAREVPVAPPPPPELEIAAKAEPKPLPSFPEPTAEEAAAIYGFGKGVRSLDDEPEAASAKDQKAPVAKAKEEDEDDFDGAATATDWRRTGGMDFEIPENTAVDPIYSYGKDLAPITFPSEKDVPPKHIRVRDEDEKAPSVAPPAPHVEARHVEAEPDGAQSFAPYGMKLSTEESSNEDAPAAWHESEAFRLAASHPESVEAEASVPSNAALVSEAKDAPVEVRDEISAKAREAVREEARKEAREDVPAVASEPAPSTTAAPARTSSWMESIAAPPSEYPEGSWMTDSLSAPAIRASEPEPAREPEPVATVPVKPSEMPEPELDLPPAKWSSSPSLEAVPPPPVHSWQSKPAPVSSAASESKWQSPPEPTRSTDREKDLNERSKKKSWFADAIEAVRDVVHGGSSESTEQSVPEAHSDVYSSPPWEPIKSTALVAQSNAPSSAPPISQSISQSTATADAAPHFDDHAHVESKSSFDSQLMHAPADSAPWRKDPALEEPPAARVTPEPLLVRDQIPASSDYGANSESVAPLQSFPLPGEAEPVNGEPAADLVATAHDEVPAFGDGAEDFEAKQFEAKPSGTDVSAPAAFGERIPTAPPPNREALSGIPFLMPTAATLESVNAPQEPAAAAINVDDMVQKVLERLEPQLHELLSKSLLKPLIENMVQNEFAKKDK